MARIDDLLRQMRLQDASDLHLTSGSPPFMRINGEIERQNYKSVSAETCKSLIFEVLTDDQKEKFDERLDLDFSYPLPGVGRFRVNVFMQRHGISACFRLIPAHIKTITELNLAEQLSDLINVSEGLILVTGPTGSGKSTTLSAFIHEINTRQQSHIITIEDPIEFVHENQRCLISQREVASHTKSFAAALRAALREDPNIILVGEMRDLETISLAITAAETGHLVFATLHTQDTAQTIDRIIDVFPPHQQQQVRVQLSVALQGIVTQQLLPTADGSGRVACCEVLGLTPAVRNLIREGKTHQIHSVLQTSGAQGMQSMDAALAQLVRGGKITRELAEQRSSTPEELRRLMGVVRAA
jgi:twitching motility protein PilT